MRVPVARICGSAIDLRRLLLELRGLDVALVRRGRAFLLRAEIQPCARHERAEARVVNGATKDTQNRRAGRFTRVVVHRLSDVFEGEDHRARVNPRGAAPIVERQRWTPLMPCERST